MKLREKWDTTSTPIDSTVFVELVVDKAAHLRGDGNRARIERLTKFCQTLFDVLPDKTKLKIASEFDWEPTE